jgi:hypothetical protein
MDSVLTAAIIKAIGDGDVKGFLAYAAIFVLIWVQVRGLKKELEKMNSSISAGFTAGEQRFEKVESEQQSFEHRLTVLEQVAKRI